MQGSGGAFGVRETHGILWQPGARVRSASDGLGWTSLYASAQQETPYEGAFPAVQDHLVILHLDGPVGVSRVLGASEERRAIAPGGLFVLPGGVDFRVRLEGGLESLHMYLRDSVLREAASDLVSGDPAAVELVPRLGDQDPLIEQLALAVREALSDPDPGAAVYVGQIARTLGARLVRAHSNRVPQSTAPTVGGLKRAQLARAIEFMDANLGRRVSLAEIAAATGLSPSHFMRRFKASVGFAPNQHLVRLRLDRAKRLLRETDRSIAQIAFDCGFSHQEHMTRFFGRLVGATPAAFRRASRS